MDLDLDVEYIECPLCEERVDYTTKVNAAYCQECKKRWCQSCATKWVVSSKNTKGAEPHCPFCRSTSVLYPFYELPYHVMNISDDELDENEEEVVGITTKFISGIIKCVSYIAGICFFLTFVTFVGWNGDDENDLELQFVINCIFVLVATFFGVIGYKLYVCLHDMAANVPNRHRHNLLV